MAQQTAVEWLFRQMTSTWYDTNSAKDILKQAKAMEKEQIKNAFDDSELHNTGNENCSEIYYNYTYNK